MELSLIQSKIYEIRGQKVMLDFDLAEMYQVQTRVLNQSVKRNIKRFPFDFMFQLTKEEWNNMSSQIVMTYPARRPKTALPYAFTEQGVAMLSGILNSDVAIAMNINIMRAFVAVRNLITSTPVNEIKELQNEVQKLKEYIEDVFTDYNDINEDTRIQLELINETLAKLQSENTSKRKDIPPVGYLVVKQKQESRKE